MVRRADISLYEESFGPFAAGSAMKASSVLRVLSPFVCLFIILISTAQCGVKQPKASATKAQPSVDHDAFKLQGIPCAQCHEHKRSPPNEDVSSTGALLKVPHGFGRSCESCHEFPTWAALPFTHNPPPSACLGCHSVAREANPHAARGECAGCHSFPDWSKIGGASLFK